MQIFTDQEKIKETNSITLIPLLVSGQFLNVQFILGTFFLFEILTKKYYLYFLYFKAFNKKKIFFALIVYAYLSSIFSFSYHARLPYVHTMQ